MTNLQRRLLKLERSELLMRHPSPLENLQAALDDAAVRLTGKDFCSVEGSEPTMERIMNDLKDSFFPTLTVGALESLMATLEPIAFGGDIAALEAARREATMETAETV